jgi:hypothetical protein
MACGTSSFCGYLRFDALSGDNAVLAHVESATTEGVLELEVDQLSLLTSVRASLLHGVDNTVVKNLDGSDVVALAKPMFVVPDDCEPLTNGSGGEGGQGGEPAQGGQPGQAGQPSQGGEPATGGESSNQAGAPVAGGAGAGGQPALGGAGGSP